MSTSSTKKPIRVGLIGLSAGGGWAATAHLPYLQQTSDFIITGICNSSIETSNAAIQSYGLDAARPFDSVSAMCASNTVDLVVCAVAVFSHYDLIKPAIEAGKDVYVEWPLTTTTEKAKELAELANQKGVRSIIGMQANVSPVQATLASVINSGRIGKLLATQMVGSACTGETGTQVVKRYAYFKDRVAEGVKGQVMLMIYVGHTFELLAKLAGQPASVSAQFATTWPRVDILDGDKKIATNIEKTADDLAILQGSTTTGVKYLYSLRGGDAFTEKEGLIWDIIGDKGQLRVTGSSIMLNLGGPSNCEIRLKDYATGKVETVSMPSPPDVPLAAQNIGLLYESFAAGGSYPTFEDAVRRHEFLDAVFTSAEDAGKLQTLA